jgi:hypothetical protein
MICVRLAGISYEKDTRACDAFSPDNVFGGDRLGTDR